MNLNHRFFDEWPWLLRVNFVFSMFFLTTAILLVSFILYLRINKNRKSKRKAELENALLDFINQYLFDEDFDKSVEVIKFKSAYIKTKFDLKITIKQILIFDENLKGESSALIKELFLDLGLFDFVLNDLKTGNWHQKARALFVFSQLSIAIPNHFIEPLLNASRDELRQQALLYSLKLADNNPLYFLGKIKKPLTMWQQIYIENGLKYSYQGTMPDFSVWLDHGLDSVVIFCIKMIAEYNQFENIPLLMPFLKNPNEEVRLETIKSLCKMEHGELLTHITTSFSEETQLIKKEMLETIQSIGSYQNLEALIPAMSKEKWNIKIEFHKASCHFKPELKYTVFSKKVGGIEEAPTTPTIAHGF